MVCEDDNVRSGTGPGILLEIVEFLYCAPPHRGLRGSSLTNPSSPPFSCLSFSPFHTSFALGAPSSCPPPSRTRRCRHRQMLLSRRAAIINTEANVLLENAIVRLIQFARNVSGPLQRAHRGEGAKKL